MKDKNTIWLFWLSIIFLFFNAWIFHAWGRIEKIDARIVSCEKQTDEIKPTIYLLDSESKPEQKKLKYAGKFIVTGYNASAACCAPYDDGYTATMTIPQEGITAAADWNVLPAGTKIYIDGIGVRTVEDSGVKGNALDLFFEDYDTASTFGVQNLDVWIIE